MGNNNTKKKEDEAPAAPLGKGQAFASNSNVHADDNKGDDEHQVQDARSTDNPDEAVTFFQNKKTVVKKNTNQSKYQNNKLRATLRASMRATLGGGELRKTVKLPDGEDENEWIAVNTVHFYNAANMIYGTCYEFCTNESCAVMSAGPKYEYLWKDGMTYKKPTRVSAPVYIDNVLAWCNDQISNPELFPVDETAQFPANFKKQVKVIYKRLFRIYAHIYYSHFDKIREIGANAHLNTCFKHFVYFIQEFDLVDKQEMTPLRKLITKFSDETN